MTYEEWLTARMDSCFSQAENQIEASEGHWLWRARATVYSECLEEWRKRDSDKRTDSGSKQSVHQSSD